MRAQHSANRSVAATVVVVSTAAFLASLDLFIVNVAYPDIRRAFHNPDLASMSWILNAYTIVFVAVLTPAGRLGDRYGHRRIFLGGLTVFLVGSLSGGLSVTFSMLVASRVLQALGAGRRRIRRAGGRIRDRDGCALHRGAKLTGAANRPQSADSSQRFAVFVRSGQADRR